MLHDEIQKKIKAAEAVRYTNDAQNCTQAYAQAQAVGIGGVTAGLGESPMGRSINGAYRPSQREEAETRVGYHRAEADRADRAAAFFREHPEFDEFIQLIRSGVVSI